MHGRDAARETVAGRAPVEADVAKLDAPVAEAATHRLGDAGGRDVDLGKVAGWSDRYVVVHDALEFLDLVECQGVSLSRRVWRGHRAAGREREGESSCVRLHGRERRLCRSRVYCSADGLSAQVFGLSSL